MLWRALVFVGWMLAVSQTAQAAQSACPPYRTPITLNFTMLNPPPVYNNRLTIDGIRNLFRTHVETVLGPHSRALGITYAETEYNVEGHSSVRETNGGYCIYLTSLDITFGWKRHQVYIASEFAPGTCEYKTVLDHENQHVAVNNGTLKELAPHFRAEIERTLQTQQPVFSRDAQAGTDTALASVEKGMSAFLTQFQKIKAERNAPLDSASNYQATSGLCSNWDKALPPRTR